MQNSKTKSEYTSSCNFVDKSIAEYDVERTPLELMIGRLTELDLTRTV